MEVKKFNEVEISWGKDSISRLIGHYKNEIENLEERQENSSFPEGEQEYLDRYEECINLLREMKDTNSWFYKKYNY